MWNRLVVLAAVVTGLSACSYNYYPTGEAACLEYLPEGGWGDRYFSKDYQNWLRYWQSTPYCQAVRARWFARNFFVPPPENILLNVNPLSCARDANGLVQVRARFTPPAGTPNVGSFNVVVGSDPRVAPGPSNVGVMVPIDASGNEIGPQQTFPQDLTGTAQGSFPATLAVDVPVAPALTPPAGRVRLVVTISANQSAQTGIQIIGVRLRTCDV
ncbi:MAG TPA: hypothetical protein VMI34_15390 [Candidatus Bathyarchaeia archaeon]|nr:hypothetical protein [Candidatus Bathyarchaeia archaeon]